MQQAVLLPELVGSWRAGLRAAVRWRAEQGKRGKGGDAKSDRTGGRAGPPVRARVRLACTDPAELCQYAARELRGWALQPASTRNAAPGTRRNQTLSDRSNCTQRVSHADCVKLQTASVF